MPRRPIHRTTRYARDVAAGRIVAGPHFRAACARHLRDLETAASRGLWFDEEAADHPIGFIEHYCRLPGTIGEDGGQRPFQLEPWQAFIVGSLFGWRSTATGHRRFRNAYIEIGKGNGKTPLLAAIGLYGLTMDGQIAPEIYAAASTRDQAMIMFRDAVAMVDASPALSSRISKSGIQHVHNLAYGQGFFRPFSREQGLKSGRRPHMGLIDEVHDHPTPDVVNLMRAGAKGNLDALFIEITNAGFDRTSVCWQHHEHSVRVAEGAIEDDRWFSYVAALDPGEDPLEDLACHLKANPNLGVSIHAPYLRDQVSAAKNLPSETNTVLRLNFCMWTLAHTKAIDLADWLACEPIPDERELAAAEWFGAFDLGETDDLTAWARLGLLEDRVIVRMRYWLPEVALERHPERPYEPWRRAGVLTVTPGEVTDYERVRATIVEDCERDGIGTVFFDPNRARETAQILQAYGLELVQVSQGTALDEAIRKFLELVKAHTLCHGGDPLLAWMAANAVLHENSKGQKRWAKERAADKIDGITAITTGIFGAIIKRDRTPPDEPELFIVGRPTAR